MYNFNAARKHTVLEATAIIANIKQKWDNLKDWPDYRGHNEPSDYPRYLHVSALCGRRRVEIEGVPQLDATGSTITELWTQKPGTTYKKPKNESADTV